jgi:hypothetical protein
VEATPNPVPINLAQLPEVLPVSNVPPQMLQKEFLSQRCEEYVHDRQHAKTTAAGTARPMKGSRIRLRGTDWQHRDVACEARYDLLLTSALLGFLTLIAFPTTVADNDWEGTEMWSIVQPAATEHPAPPTALVVSGMNDVLNRQGYTQAVWSNRIPLGVWGRMAALIVCCSPLVGYGANRYGSVLFTVLPFVISLAFFLISDIGSPRSGVIRVLPQNLVSLSQSLGK